MFKNGLYGLWGFLKLSTLLIIFFLLLGFYFWGEKAKEAADPWIQDGRKIPAVAYLKEAWNKMKGVQKMSDDRNQRALELVGETKIITEKSNRYLLAVPQDWMVEYFASAPKGQISKIILTSPAFAERREGNDVFYDNGARLTIQAIRGELTSAKADDGGHGRNLIRKEAAYIEGMDVRYHVIKDPLVKLGEVMDAHIIFGGNTYLFRYEFGADKFYGGEHTFQEILSSLKFGK